MEAPNCAMVFPHFFPGGNGLSITFMYIYIGNSLDPESGSDTVSRAKDSDFVHRNALFSKRV